eukprot:2635386-Rhodomonas_salina.2
MHDTRTKPYGFDLWHSKAVFGGIVTICNHISKNSLFRNLQEAHPAPAAGRPRRRGVSLRLSESVLSARRVEDVPASRPCQ